MAYGGASGQHACRLADELGLQSVLFHPLAGVLSAYGMGQARQSCRLQHHVGAQLSPDWLTTLPGQISKLVEQARLRLQQQGDIKDATEGCATHVRLDLRYPVLTNLALGLALGLDCDGLIQQFQDLHQQRFGYCVDGDQQLVVEMVHVEVAAPPATPVRGLDAAVQPGPRFWGTGPDAIASRSSRLV